MEDLSGSSLGTYRLLSVLGRGAQATVYRARQESVERDVAVKVLIAEHARGPEFKQRFVREARAAAALEHPNVLPIYDYGEENGRCYIVMRLAAGSLSQRLEQAPPLTLEESVAIVNDLGAALDCAHARKIVHRDVKPANVLLDARGRCLLADFGIAKLLDDSNLRTQTNLAVGTPNYMSPEQCSGLPIDGRADVYALAVLAYELVVGCRPFRADTPHAIAMMHLAEPVSFPAEATHVSAAVRAALLRGLDKNREDRSASAGEFASTLAQAARSSQTNVTRALEVRADATSNAPRRSRALAASLVLGATAFGGLYLGRAAWTDTVAADSGDDSPRAESDADERVVESSETRRPARATPALWTEFSVAVGHDWSIEGLRSSGLGAQLESLVAEPLVDDLSKRGGGIGATQRVGALVDSHFSPASDAAAISVRHDRDLAVVLSYRWIEGRFEQPNRLIDDENRWRAQPRIELASSLVFGARSIPLASLELSTRQPVETSSLDAAVGAALSEGARDFIERSAERLERWTREVLANGLETRFAVLLDDPTREFESELAEAVLELEGVVAGSLQRLPDAEYRRQAGIVRLPAPPGTGDGRPHEFGLELDDHFSLWSVRIRADELALHQRLAAALDDVVGESVEREPYSFTTRRWHDLTLYLFKKRSAAMSESAQPATPRPAGAASAWKPLIVTDNVLYPSYVLATANAGASAPNALPGLIAIAWRQPTAGSKLSVHIECPDLIEPSDDAFEAPVGSGDALFFPKIRFKYPALLALRQARPIDLTFDVSIDGAPAERIVLGARAASVNVCPFAKLLERDSGEAKVLAWPWMFAAYANEDHPLVDRIGKAAIDHGFIDAWIGYQGGAPEAVLSQALALWATCVAQGIRYSSITASSSDGATPNVLEQHVRFIDESWENTQANCVDGSVLFASVLQKVGIESALVLVPGHCLVAFSLDGSLEPRSLRCIETTALGGAPSSRGLTPKEHVRKLAAHFDAALVAGQKHLDAALNPKGDGLHLVIPISAARRAGVLPIPCSR